MGSKQSQSLYEATTMASAEKPSNLVLNLAWGMIKWASLRRDAH